MAVSTFRVSTMGRRMSTARASGSPVSSGRAAKPWRARISRTQGAAGSAGRKRP